MCSCRHGVAEGAFAKAAKLDRLKLQAWFEPMSGRERAPARFGGLTDDRAGKFATASTRWHVPHQ